MEGIIFGVMLLSLVIWIGLLTLRGQFWRTDQRLEVGETMLESSPTVCAVIPARNEADLLPVSLRSLLRQDYHGSFTVFLVDDHSTDGTPDIAEGVACALNKSQQLQIISAQTLPPGWTGKLWAMEQGIQAVETRNVASLQKPDYFLLTDADIEHDIANLRRLVAKAEQDNLDLVSVMVRLRCKSFWEQLLIPAFVFFFQKLYPFRWVNDPNNTTAAAAGGCILIRREALNRIGGIKAVRHALIDDCALASAVKRKRGGVGEGGMGRQGDLGTRRLGDKETWRQGDLETRRLGDNCFSPFGRASRLNAGNPRTALDSPSPPLSIPPSPYPPLPHSSTPSTGRIWLGLSTKTRSLRPYPSLATIWDMVARSAYTQLNYSPLLLILTLVGMILIYMVPPLGIIWGALMGNWGIVFTAFLTWLLMSLAYLPTIRFYKCPVWLVFCLSAIAFLYTLMTLDSALRHWQGRGGAWKGRVYPG
ncbi:glycosyl transferase family protein [Tolypothrix sp. NIES-4075]|uniref:glycosyltransferase n=1 Tax=Tolypothrix sp. NIES-4075 TaxID=2005459 RepID=UPI000B70AED8|nr:glycosyltransferase [Tolypothrix sp. NIES-4075]GAX43919.1 glycosyl transferase family protein [Tolypothrix sp. NIES-4075]